MKPRLFVISVHLCLAGLLTTNTWTRADDASVSCDRPGHCLQVLAPDDIKERFGEHVPHPAFWQPDGWVRRTMNNTGRSYGTPEPLAGTFRMPVVMYGYSDYPIAEGTEELVETLCIGEWPIRSVASFYDQASKGKFNIEFEFFVVESLPNTENYYEGFPSGPNSNSTQDTAILADLLPLLDDMADFRQFDNDGPDGIPNSGDDDGFIDGLMIVSPTTSGYDTVRQQWNIWPHAALGSHTTDDIGINGQYLRLGKYCIQSALRTHPNELWDPEIKCRTFIHEMGHVLGCKDLYHKLDPNKPEEHWAGLGAFCQMSAGNGQISAWPRYKWGWADAVRLNGVQEELITFPRVSDEDKIFRIDLNYIGSEYLLIEYRDDSPPHDEVGSGLLIYHVDDANGHSNFSYTSDCSGLDQENHPHIQLLEADAGCDLAAGGDFFSRPEDYWMPATQNRFASDTFPHALSYSSIDLGIEIREISQPGGDFVTAVVSAGEPPIVELAGPLDIAWAFDLSSSYEDDLEFMRDQIKDAIDLVEFYYPGSRHNLSFFSDFPKWPYGVPGDIAYFNLSSGVFTENPRRVKQFIDSMTVFNGGDYPECQYETIYQLLRGEGRDFNGDGLYKVEDGDISPYDMDWNAAYTPAIIVMTDAPTHDGLNEPDYPFGDPDDPSDDGNPDKVAGLLDLHIGIFEHEQAHGHRPHIFFLDAVDPFVLGNDTSPSGEPSEWTDLHLQIVELISITNGGYVEAGENTSSFKEAVEEVLQMLSIASPRGGSCCIGGGVDCQENITAQQCAELGGSFLPHNWRCELDCNGDGKSDACELILGSLQDLNNNGAPDSCECLGDVDEDGEIEIDDLLKVVGYWGEWMEDTVCEADFNRDWEVDIEDLLYVLNRWGNC
ncbi:MAG: hypothetical protein P8M22_13045, partial [Phycisphaerales bacterium]|nr:hypothetical protein [Phycisphaerales bacterium]